jgi:hypothetical protein
MVFSRLKKDSRAVFSDDPYAVECIPAQPYGGRTGTASSGKHTQVEAVRA